MRLLFFHVLLHLLGYLVIYMEGYLFWCWCRGQFVPLNTFCSWCEKEKKNISPLFLIIDFSTGHFGERLWMDTWEFSTCRCDELPHGSLLFMWLNWRASERLCFNCCSCELSVKWKEAHGCTVLCLSDWWRPQTYKCEQSSQMQIF